EARRARDAVLEQGTTEATAARLDRLGRRVRRSRALRWSLRGLRPLGADDVHRLGLPGHATGDTYDRLLRMLERVTGTSDGHTGPAHDHACPIGHLAHVVSGLDLATARLVVASLDLHDLRADHAGHEVSHG